MTTIRDIFGWLVPKKKETITCELQEEHIYRALELYDAFNEKPSKLGKRAFWKYCIKRLPELDKGNWDVDVRALSIKFTKIK